MSVDLRKIVSLLMLALIASPSLGIVAMATSLTVSTDREDYTAGEVVEIQGTADSNASVTIIVNRTLETMYTINVTAGEDGAYSATLPLSDDAPEGLYIVTASADNATAQTFFTVTLTDVEEEVEEVEEGFKRAGGLRVAVERALIFIERIRATAKRLQEEGYQIEASQINETLEEVEIQLNDLYSRLQSGEIDIDEAAKEFATARGMLGRTMELLHSTAKKIKAVKAERFLEHVENRIHGLEEKINRLRNGLAAGEVVSANVALHNAEMRLQRLRERLAAGEVDEAIEGLSDAVEEIDEGLGELNGRGVSNILREMNRLEAKIRVMKATAERLARKGSDSYEIEEELQSAEALLSEMMARLEEGDTYAAVDLLEAVEEHLEKARKGNQGMIRSKIVKKVGKWIEKVKKRGPKNNED